MFRKKGDTYNQIRDAHTSATHKPAPKSVPLQRIPVKSPGPTVQPVPVTVKKTLA